MEDSLEIKKRSDFKNSKLGFDESVLVNLFTATSVVDKRFITVVAHWWIL